MARHEAEVIAAITRRVEDAHYAGLRENFFRFCGRPEPSKLFAKAQKRRAR